MSYLPCQSEHNSKLHFLSHTQEMQEAQRRKADEWAAKNLATKGKGKKGGKK
jgi:hypothetical protein